MPGPQPALACPVCHTRLEEKGRECLVCPLDGRLYPLQDGIWRCLLPERENNYVRFLQEYDLVRNAEGRGSQEAAYYRALPYAAPDDPHYAAWRQRAHSYAALLQHVIAACEAQTSRPLGILELGAGNGWLSNRLAQRGHRLAALDLRTGALDGLGALRYYERPIIAVQAEFNYLPFQDSSVDLAVFNASLHYSIDYATTLAEARRVLSPVGRLAIVDTPVYRQAASGQAMLAEKRAQFMQLYGFAADALPSEEFLTPTRLKQLGVEVGLAWQALQPAFGLRWRLRRWRARLLGRREPANFPLLVGRPL